MQKIFINLFINSLTSDILVNHYNFNFQYFNFIQHAIITFVTVNSYSGDGLDKVKILFFICIPDVYNEYFQHFIYSLFELDIKRETFFKLHL